MTTTALRKSIVRKIEKLPPKELKIINEIIESLEEDEEATKELLEIPGFLERLKEAENSIKRGEFVNWEDIKRDV